MRTFEVGQAVHILADESENAYGPFSGAGSGQVVAVHEYPAPYPTLYEVGGAGRMAHPYTEDRLEAQP